MSLQGRLIHIFTTGLFLGMLFGPPTLLAATKKVTVNGGIPVWQGNQYILFTYTVDSKFQWWGGWQWDYYYGNWATDTWDFQIGGTVRSGALYDPAFRVEPVQPHAWWIDLVTYYNLEIPPGYMYSIGCLVNYPNSCRQFAYFGGGRNAGLYIVGKGARWRSQVGVWKTASPWNYQTVSFPNIDLW